MESDYCEIVGERQSPKSAEPERAQKKKRKLLAKVEASVIKPDKSLLIDTTDEERGGDLRSGGSVPFHPVVSTGAMAHNQPTKNGDINANADDTVREAKDAARHRAQVQDECRQTLECIEEELRTKRLLLHSLQSEIQELEQQQNQVVQRSEEIEASRQQTQVDVQNYEAKALEIARKFFGVQGFRPHQLDVIANVLSGIDCFCIMPTGGGKSLCFQIPGLMNNSGLTVVISPLLSLMMDQVMTLKALGVNAEMLTAGQKKEEAVMVKNQMKRLGRDKSNNEDRLRFLYVTPEKLAKSKQFMNALEQIHQAGNLFLLVVDEVHCVSEWGHSFREDYKYLSVLKIHFKKTPILSLSATATPRVIQDVKQILKMPFCRIFKTPINRANLFYQVLHKPKEAAEVNALTARCIRAMGSNATGIIYCLSRKDAEKLSADLSGPKENVSCAYYHADLSAEERERIQTRWTSGQIQVVIATVAFGMGINKADVRFVIHHSLSKSLESYYQESGRAGRDGELAYCIVLYRPSDIFRLSTMLYYERSGLELLYKMANFCRASKECRKRLLSLHFGDRPPVCNAMCENCTIVPGGQATHLSASASSSSVRKDNPSPRYLSEALKQLLCVLKRADDPAVKYTLLQLYQEWKRNMSKCKKLCDTIKNASNEFDQLPMDETDWFQMLTVDLLLLGYLREEFFHSLYSTNSYLRLTHEGRTLLNNLNYNGADDSEPNIVVTQLALSTAPSRSLPHRLTSSSVECTRPAQTDCNPHSEKLNGLLKRKLLAWRSSPKYAPYGHLVLTGNEVVKIAQNISASVSSIQDLPLQASCLSTLCERKIEIYAPEILSVLSATLESYLSQATLS